jgi:hypothetical protein
MADFLDVLKYTREFGASEPQDRIDAFTSLSSELTGIDHIININ